MPPKPSPPTTPDGHYIVVRGRLWRATNPHLPEAERAEAVQALMLARRDVQRCRGDAAAVAEARARVHAAKVALGERGPPWWGGDAPSYDRCMARNTPYSSWYDSLGREP